MVAKKKYNIKKHQGHNYRTKFVKKRNQAFTKSHARNVIKYKQDKPNANYKTREEEHLWNMIHLYVNISVLVLHVWK